MTVIDLIIKLQSLPPNMEVLLDVSSDNSTGFKFVTLNELEELEEPSCILLTTGLDEGDNGLQTGSTNLSDFLYFLNLI